MNSNCGLSGGGLTWANLDVAVGTGPELRGPCGQYKIRAQLLPTGDKTHPLIIIQHVTFDVSDIAVESTRFWTPLVEQVGLCGSDRGTLSLEFWEAFIWRPEEPSAAIDTNKFSGIATVQSSVNVRTEARLYTFDEFNQVLGVPEVLQSEDLRLTLLWDGFCFPSEADYLCPSIIPQPPEGDAPIPRVVVGDGGVETHPVAATSRNEFFVSGGAPVALSEPAIWGLAARGGLVRDFNFEIHDCCEQVSDHTGENSAETTTFSVPPVQCAD